LRTFTNVVLRERERGEALAIAAAGEALEISEEPPSGEPGKASAATRAHRLREAGGGRIRL
jgi:hypothetical protein